MKMLLFHRVTDTSLGIKIGFIYRFLLLSSSERPVPCNIYSVISFLQLYLYIYSGAPYQTTTLLPLFQYDILIIRSQAQCSKLLKFASPCIIIFLKFIT